MSKIQMGLIGLGNRCKMPALPLK